MGLSRRGAVLYVAMGGDRLLLVGGLSVGAVVGAVHDLVSYRLVHQRLTHLGLYKIDGNWEEIVT